MGLNIFFIKFCRWLQSKDDVIFFEGVSIYPYSPLKILVRLTPGLFPLLCATPANLRHLGVLISLITLQGFILGNIFSVFPFKLWLRLVVSRETYIFVQLLAHLPQACWCRDMSPTDNPT